jgi:hypothetical protein
MDLMFHDARGARVDMFYVRDDAEAIDSARANIKAEPGAFVLAFASAGAASRQHASLAWSMHYVEYYDGEHWRHDVVRHDFPPPEREHVDRRTSREIVNAKRAAL